MLAPHRYARHHLHSATLAQAAPELRDELTATLELLDDYSLMPAQRAAKRIVLKRMRTRKTPKRQ